MGSASQRLGKNTQGWVFSNICIDTLLQEVTCVVDTIYSICGKHLFDFMFFFYFPGGQPQEEHEGLWESPSRSGKVG